jgi:hypothetical protein
MSPEPASHLPSHAVTCALSALSHVHTTSPSLASPWCPQCSAQVDWAIVWVDAAQCAEGA